MRDRGQIFIGISLIVLGALFLLGSLLDVDVWKFCWPVAFILLGVWLLLRPLTARSDARVRQRLVGDIRRDGTWQVTDEEIWIGVGDLDLDMSEAEIPLGETRIQIYGFVADVDVYLPPGVGVALSSTAFVTEAGLFGRKRERFLSTLYLSSDDYESAERKIRLDMTCFVAEFKIKQV